MKVVTEYFLIAYQSITSDYACYGGSSQVHNTFVNIFRFDINIGKGPFTFYSIESINVNLHEQRKNQIYFIDNLTTAIDASI